MNDQQRESTAKFLYDMAKGVGLIAVVSGVVSGQTSWWNVIMGSVSMSSLFLLAYWLEGRGNNKDGTAHVF
ncbi:MAG TPA: hypothetical protein VF879_06495 [Nitrospirales bacterium]